MDKGGSITAAAFIYGDPELPFWAGGQGVGLIDRIIPCADLIAKIMDEARKSFRGFNRWRAPEKFI